MEIDLRKVGMGVEMDRYQEMNLKSSHLLREMNRISITMEENFNYIVIPISIYNMIENHELFVSRVTKPTDENLYHVGTWLEFEVYVDMLMQPNNILMRYDKQTRRDIRINKLLNDISDVEELTIEVKDFSLENPY